MLVTLGFLSATLLALAAVPALARRADRLARKRAEAAFPLSLGEIAADRDHLRAELALRARALEQQAERGFAARAGAMQEIGRRDMTIAQRESELRQRDATIAEIEGRLAATQGELTATQARLAEETSAHLETAATLAKRVADLASVEHILAETRTALTGTSADLSARASELAAERATLGRVEALLAERESDLAKQRADNDALRVAQVENRTQILILEGKRDDLAGRLDASEAGLAETRKALDAMTIDRDSELRADALGVRATQAEAGLAAADAASIVASGEAKRLVSEREGLSVALAELEAKVAAAEAALHDNNRAMKAMQTRHDEESAAMREELQERDQRFETLHAEIVTLQGALAQARADRLKLKREAAKAGRTPASQGDDGKPGGNAALRQEIVAVADRLMTLTPKREAAE